MLFTCMNKDKVRASLAIQKYPNKNANAIRIIVNSNQFN